MYTDDVYLHDIHQDMMIILKKFDAYCRKHNLKYSLCGGSTIGAIRHQGFIPWDDDLDFMMTREEYRKLQKCIKEDPIEGIFFQTYETDKNFPHDFAKLRLEGTKGREWIHQRVKMHEGVFADIFPVDNVKGHSGKFNTFMCRVLDFMVWFKTALFFPPKVWMYPFVFILELITVFPFLCNFIPMRTLSKWREKFFTRNNDKPCDYVGILAGYAKNDTFIPKSALNDEYMDIMFEGEKTMIITNYNAYLRHCYGDYMTPPPLDKQHGKHGYVGYVPFKNNKE